MDAFGIGAAMQSMVEVYARSARQTGRTVSLVESLKTGDRVCFLNVKEAKRVQDLCKERNVEIETVVCNVGDPRHLFERGSVRAEGRFIFDHGWVEEFYRFRIERLAKDIDHLQTELGGFGEAHRKTARAYREIARWR